MVKTYDPKLITVLVGGNPIGGFADGTSVKIVMSTDNYVKSTGMDGVTTRTKQNDRSGEITLTLAQTSPSNDILSDYEVSSYSGDSFEVVITDTVTLSEYTGTAWVKKQADVEYAKALTNREWVLEVADLKMATKGIPDA